MLVERPGNSGMIAIVEGQPESRNDQGSGVYQQQMLARFEILIERLGLDGQWPLVFIWRI